jgi:hypothetical protein
LRKLSKFSSTLQPRSSSLNTLPQHLSTHTRGHAILTIYLEARKFSTVHSTTIPSTDDDSHTPSKSRPSLSSELTIGRINFVDLAGAERLPAVTTNTPKTLRQSLTETHNINLSLNALGSCFCVFVFVFLCFCLFRILVCSYSGCVLLAFCCVLYFECILLAFYAFILVAFCLHFFRVLLVFY